MDFLKRLAIEIDVGGGVLRFSETSPPIWCHANTRVKLKIVSRVLHTAVRLPSDLEEPFILDTGAHSSFLRALSIDSLVATNEISLSGSQRSFADSGEVKPRFGCVSQMTVASFTHKDVHRNRDSSSILGLRYL